MSKIKEEAKVLAKEICPWCKAKDPHMKDCTICGGIGKVPAAQSDTSPPPNGDGN